MPHTLIVALASALIAGIMGLTFLFTSFMPDSEG